MEKLFARRLDMSLGFFGLKLLVALRESILETLGLGKPPIPQGIPSGQHSQKEESLR